ncbi:MAG: ATP synthase F1 subunit gamma [Candidatus Limivicinus sp.]
MANIYAIKARIKGVESTQKITRTMKLVSTSKLHQTQGQLYRLGSFADKCRQSLNLVLAAAQGEDCPLLQSREVRRVCYVLFVGNRGLCGAYNSDALRCLKDLLRQEEADYFTLLCGRWSGEHRTDPVLRVRQCFDDVSDVPRPEESRTLAQYLQQLYLSGEADRIVLVYQRREALGQKPCSFQLLPLAQEEGAARGGDCIFEPDRQTLMDTLSRMYVENSVMKALLEAKVSEHFARMTAMTNATDNAEELMKELSLSLNRTRQARITTEISEVVGGANALRNGE